ncbi:MAG TPA: IS1595 family transposase [Terriglobales bacterium]|nr:IS1595 family transposase [Terriglobales bacterium]
MASQDIPNSLLEVIRYFSDVDVCIEFIASLRWLDGKVQCPHCEAKNAGFLKSRRIWKCRECRKQFSVKTGTIFEESPIALDKWLMAIWLVVNCKNGVSSYEIARDLKVTQKSAWFMLHRIRLALKNGNWSKLGGTGGPVEVDETFLGGNPKNMHAKRRLSLKAGIEGGHAEKTIVFGMLDRDTRQVRTEIVPNVKRETLQSAILDRVGFGSTVYSDGWKGYNGLKAEQFVHETVNHMDEYVRGSVHTQGIENFWSLLKRGLKGTYVAVEPFHLSRYLDEQMFRFNNRGTKDNPLNDGDRFMLAVSQISGKRLTYAELTGKVGQTAV